ncbi:hypothetical protein [Sodalis glossinidius]|uniref:hypothetical protein n=1 Tax=Sodalis glossinidius TaxID=63612 RepID=UPI0011D0619D|nr:hypothetical protein [Sodalis glossinidius]
MSTARIYSGYASCEKIFCFGYLDDDFSDFEREVAEEVSLFLQSENPPPLTDHATSSLLLPLALPSPLALLLLSGEEPRSTLPAERPTYLTGYYWQD